MTFVEFVPPNIFGLEMPFVACNNGRGGFNTCWVKIDPTSEMLILMSAC